MDNLEWEPGSKAQVDDPLHASVVGRWLMLAALVASLATVPYVYSFETQRAREPKPASELATEMAENVGFEFLISCCFIVLGIRLRKSLGLSVRLLDNWPAEDAAAHRRVWNTITLSVMMGLGLGIVLAIADYYVEPMMPKPRRPLPTPPAWAGLLASVGAGIQEEIWTRLGMMTLLVWIGTRVIRRRPPAAVVVWIGNILAALFFGALHIPQAAVLLGPTPIIIAYTLIANGVPGVVFGWLYWRRGLVAAMVCHFAGDLLLKAILPLLGLA